MRTPWLLLPAAAVLVVLFAAPAALLLKTSLQQHSMFGPAPGLDLTTYPRVLSQYGGVLMRTLVIALATATLVSAVAFSVAVALRFLGARFAAVLLVAVMATMFGGYLAKIYAWKVILGNEGLINAVLVGLGLLSEPTDRLLYTPGAVVVVLTVLLLPYAILPVYAALRSIPDAVIEAAVDLGAGRWRIAREVLLPIGRQGIFTAFALSLLLASGDFLTPTLVGGPAAGMTGLFIYGQFVNAGNWPMGAALAISSLASVTAALIALRALFARLGPRW